jgi:sporulation protein YlmC with PRC-barrel domain
MHRKYPLDAEVHGTDGYFGRSTYLVVNPTNEKVTHIVVSSRKNPQQELMVPTRYVKESTPELILLSLNRDEIMGLEPFHKRYFSNRKIHRYGSDPHMVMLWPYVVPETKVITDHYTTVPPGALAVRRGARVKATDAFVGEVSEFIVDPETGYISHMVLRKGLPWDRKYVTIAITEIDHIGEKVVYLKLNKKELNQIQAIPVRYPY